MHVAIPLFPGFTALDIVGPYTMLAFAPGWHVTLVAPEHGAVLDDRGTLSLMATATYDEVTAPDVVLVPGGPGVEQALGDPALLSWLQGVDTRTTWTTSVCAGSLILGAAGMLAGRRATTHWGWLDVLPGFGAESVGERVVFDGKYVTAAGVSAGLDMALTLLGRESGEEVARAVQLAVEYDPRPPYDSGSAHTASEELRGAALALI